MDLRPIGRALRKLRREQGLTQIELASISGVHRNHIGLIERAERNASCLTLAGLLGGLGVSWEEFGRRVDDQARLVDD